MLSEVIKFVKIIWIVLNLELKLYRIWTSNRRIELTIFFVCFLGVDWQWEDQVNITSYCQCLLLVY